MLFVTVLLCLCAAFTAVPYAIGSLSLGRSAEFFEAYSFGLMLEGGLLLLILHAGKIAITASGLG
jgi:hypothetical protein